MPQIEGRINGCQWSCSVQRVASMAATNIRFPQGGVNITDTSMAGLDQFAGMNVIRSLLNAVNVIQTVGVDSPEPLGAIIEGADPSGLFPPLITSMTTFGDLAPVSRERIVNLVWSVIEGSWPVGSPQPSWTPYDEPEDTDPEPDTDENNDQECYDCEREGYMDRISINEGTSRETLLWVCESCRLDNYPWCVEHRGYTDTRSVEYNWDDEICERCSRDRLPNVVRPWDHRPALQFHPVPPEGDHPLYIGMELEASFTRVRQGRTWASTYLPEFDGLLYAKSDSSVSSGFEVVTHPMQPLWAMENLPFHIFQKGIEEFGMLPTHDSTGTHVHMNKDAFDGPTLWKFLQIHMKLPEFCGLVGGRGTDASFGSFSRNRDNFLGLQRGELLDIVKKKGKYDNPERYIAVNLRNEYTLELRYMRGGMAPYEIKKNIQWALALYDFAHYLNIRDVKDGALADPGYLLGFINSREDQFPDLVKWVGKQIPVPLDLAERE